jgi:hypothetical protein
LGRSPTRRRQSWDERQGDLFGASAPKPVAAKRPVPTIPRKTPEDEPVDAPSLSSLAKRASRQEIEDMVNELGDDELAHLILRGVKTVKRRLARVGQGAGRSTRSDGRRTALDRALQEIATELSGFDESDADW